MSKQLQLFFDKTLDNERKVKDIKRMIKDALISSQQYSELEEKRKEIVNKMRQVQEAILSDYNSEIDKLDLLKTEVEHDKLMISDKALNELVKGKMIEPVEDKFGNKYEAQLIVKFKKIK